MYNICSKNNDTGKYDMFVLLETQTRKRPRSRQSPEKRRHRVRAGQELLLGEPLVKAIQRRGPVQGARERSATLGQILNLMRFLTLKKWIRALSLWLVLPEGQGDKQVSYITHLTLASNASAKTNTHVACEHQCWFRGRCHRSSL